MFENIESKYSSQSKELTNVQSKLLQATDPRILKLEKEPLERTIKELEGEVQILSMREKDFRIALVNKE